MRTALRPDPWLTGPWLWLLIAGVAYGIGWFWVFPPLGGPLLAVNVFFARTLTYRAELLAYEYLRADEEVRNEELGHEEPPAETELARVPRPA